jgi:exodeoxyribonuclease VII small subunit
VTIPAPDPNLSFEQALANLEAIIDRIESGNVGLEQAIGEYERGVALIRRCKDILQKAEQRVDELNRQAAGLDRAGGNAGNGGGGGEPERS